MKCFCCIAAKKKERKKRRRRIEKKLHEKKVTSRQCVDKVAGACSLEHNDLQKCFGDAGLYDMRGNPAVSLPFFSSAQVAHPTVKVQPLRFSC